MEQTIIKILMEGIGSKINLVKDNDTVSVFGMDYVKGNNTQIELLRSKVPDIARNILEEMKEKHEIIKNKYFDGIIEGKSMFYITKDANESIIKYLEEVKDLLK